MIRDYVALQRTGLAGPKTRGDGSGIFFLPNTDSHLGILSGALHVGVGRDNGAALGVDGDDDVAHHERAALSTSVGHVKGVRVELVEVRKRSLRKLEGGRAAQTRYAVAELGLDEALKGLPLNEVANVLHRQAVDLGTEHLVLDVLRLANRRGRGGAAAWPLEGDGGARSLDRCHGFRGRHGVNMQVLGENCDESVRNGVA